MTSQQTRRVPRWRFARSDLGRRILSARWARVNEVTAQAETKTVCAAGLTPSLPDGAVPVKMEKYGVPCSLDQPFVKSGARTVKRTFTASIAQEGGWYVAQCLEVDLASQGETEEESLFNLGEALTLYFTPPVATVLPDLRPIEVEIGAA